MIANGAVINTAIVMAIWRKDSRISPHQGPHRNLYPSGKCILLKNISWQCVISKNSFQNLLLTIIFEKLVNQCICYFIVKFFFINIATIFTVFSKLINDALMINMYE